MNAFGLLHSLAVLIVPILATACWWEVFGPPLESFGSTDQARISGMVTLGWFWAWLVYEGICDAIRNRD